MFFKSNISKIFHLSYHFLARNYKIDRAHSLSIHSFHEAMILLDCEHVHSIKVTVAILNRAKGNRA
jgi:hypothetical protein